LVRFRIKLTAVILSAVVTVSLINPPTVHASGFETYKMYGFDRVNVRDEYDSDEVYANFRAVNIGGLGHNVLLRGASPVDPALNRSTYADRLLRAYKVNAVINLSNTSSEIDSYRSYRYYHSDYYDSLLSQGKVLVAKIAANGYETEEYCRELTNRLAFMTKIPGPYYIHCKEGKDRSGIGCLLLECLMGADFNSIAEDYVRTFVDFTRIGYSVSPEQRSAIIDTNVRALMGVVTGLPNETDFDKVNLIQAAEAYLKRGGMSDADIVQLKKNLSVSYDDPVDVFDGNYYGPVFDAGYYMSHYPEAAEYAKNDPRKALRYFVIYGMYRGHSGNGKFDPKEYLKENPRLKEMYGSNNEMLYYHYIRHGQYGEGAVYDDPELYVTMMYHSFLSREPDAGGLANWSELLRQHLCSGAKAVYGFVYSQEYQSLNLDDREFIRQMYDIVFKRTPDNSGYNDWLEVLANGATRRKVLEGFLNSSEMKNLCSIMGVNPGEFNSEDYIDNNYGVASFVASLYRHGLKRQFKREELVTWTQILVDGSRSPSGVALAFLDGNEYRNLRQSDESFIRLLYLVLLGRVPSDAELKSRTQQLKAGATRAEVITDICASEEFRQICAKKHMRI
jgi:hypothetical protein